MQSIVDTRLTEHFTLFEFLRSERAVELDIDMTPPARVVANLFRVCRDVLEPVRARFGAPVMVTSGYRPPALNEAIGGSASSAHMHGLAADFRVRGVAPIEVCRWIASSGLLFDQVILEFDNWTHVGLRADVRAQRREALTYWRDRNARTRMLRGIVPVEARDA
jgi:hypothetical protein